MLTQGEFLRKAVHLFFSILIIPIIFWPKHLTLLLLSVIFLFMTIVEISRAYNLKLWITLRDLYEPLLRKQEKQSGFRFKSADYYILSLLITYIIFDKRTTICAFLVMVFGDAAAAIVGSKFGKIKLTPFNKTLEGAIAMLITSILIIYAIPKILGFSDFTYSTVITAAIVATLTEMLGQKFLKIDDNISIVLTTACTFKIMATLS